MKLDKEQFLKDLASLCNNKFSRCHFIGKWMKKGEMEIFPLKEDSHHELVLESDIVYYRTIPTGEKERLRNQPIELIYSLFDEVKERIIQSFQ